MSVPEQGSASNLYRIEEEIGSGGMGTVYRALDVQLKRPVALKVLRDPDDADLLERFLREQEITAELDHPNFVKILSTGYMRVGAESLPFYTMPLISGLTLERLVARRRERTGEGERLRAEFTMPRLLQIMQQVCLTVQSAHDKRVIHRDLKPQNIIVGPYGDTYLMDLGLAKRLAPQGKETRCFSAFVLKQLAKTLELGLTGNMILGTPYYMAPEQILSPRTVDARADIFGLGAILYYLLTARRPQYLEPGIDLTCLEERRQILLVELQPHMGDGGINGLLGAPDSRVPEAARRSLEEYREVLGLIVGDDWSLLRLTMKDCRIIPPREVVLRAREEDEHSCDNVDPALEAICMTALARDPAARYPSCRAMWNELQQYLEKRPELILKRKGQELARDASRATAPSALQYYEEAQLTLQESLAEHEKSGRLAMEDRLELFDVLLGKAGVLDRCGDRDAVARVMTAAEPLMDSTLTVLQRQVIQVLLSKGMAQSRKGQPDSAKILLRRAMLLADAQGDADLRIDAAYQYGLASVAAYHRSRNSDDFDQGEDALQDAMRAADGLGNRLAGIRARLGLARLYQDHPGAVEAAGRLLEDALRHAANDPSALPAAHLAMSAFCIRSEKYPAAVRHGEESARSARAAGLQAELQDALFALGRAYHFSGNGERRASTFRELIASHGFRNPSLVKDLARFYEEQRLDAAEIAVETEVPAPPQVG